MDSAHTHHTHKEALFLRSTIMVTDVCASVHVLVFTTVAIVIISTNRYTNILIIHL